MKPIRHLFFLSLILVSLACGCVLPSALGGIQGSGNLITVEKDLSGFTSLDVHHGCRLNVMQAESYSVVVRIDDNLVDYLELEQHGSTLRIGMKSGRSYSRVQLEADITMPDIEQLDMGGGSEGRITGFQLEHSFSVSLSGGGELSGVLDTGDLQVSLSGGSEITLEGSGSDLDVAGSGGAAIHLGDFRAKDVQVDLSGGSQATVYVDGRLTGDLSGGATVYYNGNAELGSISKSGGARVVQK
jgi:hypothetical protein